MTAAAWAERDQPLEAFLHATWPRSIPTDYEPPYCPRIAEAQRAARGLQTVCEIELDTIDQQIALLSAKAAAGLPPFEYPDAPDAQSRARRAEANLLEHLPYQALRERKRYYSSRRAYLGALVREMGAFLASNSYHAG